MEYEIEDDEALFDESTNPSLKHEHRQAIENQSSVRPGDYPKKKRRLQEAEVIPEEEPA